jgi:hypothetical protein
MWKKTVIILSGFALVGYTGGALSAQWAYGDRDWIEQTLIKLIEKYYELSQRVERLERQAQKQEREEKEQSIKEKMQTKGRVRVRVRACPRVRCATVVVLERGEVVSLLSRKGSWFLVETTDGVRGWVSSVYLQDYSY